MTPNNGPTAARHNGGSDFSPILRCYTLLYMRMFPILLIFLSLAAAQIVVNNGNNGTATPTGAAGGALSGTYPNPSLANPVSVVSLLASGIVDGQAPVTITTAATATLGGAYNSGYTYNQEATSATAITYTLPTASAGKQYCVGNSYNGSAPTTGTLEILTSASGQYIIFTDGTLSASGGYVQSSGAAADFACVVGVDSTHWFFRPSSGVWSKH